MKVSLQSIAVRAPGLDGWETAQPILAGRVEWQPTLPNIPACGLLKPNERRRLTPALKLALALAEEATAGLGDEVRGTLPSVFASTLGDSTIIDAICTALAQPERPISPTRFHNSVHNAAAGYWAMATGNREPSNSMAAGEWTAGAGLLEALSQVEALGRPVLFVLYDILPPEALAPLAGIHQPFGMALRLAPTGEVGLCELEATVGETLETRLAPPWESLRMAAPATRHLALLHAVATGRPAVALPLNREHNLEVTLNHAD